MKILIGITQEPKAIKSLLIQRNGNEQTLTEMGPFLSKEDACSWLQFLKSKITSLEEIVPQEDLGPEKLWYGFTFELQ